ncbi:hypothetical protein E4U42_007271 [Claviceps africana]|uniref:Secreted protein n=1 Tax=Claviceps africana TaxID=83212 RepID=A0A8K0J1J5_9HYPO|nr:hypothetical protein E4U42_007271 [Claviceps africana]
MKLASTLTLLVAITGASSRSVEKRNTPVRKVIVDLTDGLTDLWEVSRAFNGDMDPVVRSSDRLVEILKHGQEVADGADPIELSDSYTLAEPTRALDARCKALYKTLMAKVDQVRASRACGTTREKLMIINDLSLHLIQTIIDKQVAPIARGVAKRIARAIKKKFRTLIFAYDKENCPF